MVNTPSSLLESAVVMSQLVNRKSLEFLHPMYKISCQNIMRSSSLLNIHSYSFVIVYSALLSTGTHDKSYASLCTFVEAG